MRPDEVLLAHESRQCDEAVAIGVTRAGLEQSIALRAGVIEPSRHRLIDREAEHEPRYVLQAIGIDQGTEELVRPPRRFLHLAVVGGGLSSDRQKIGFPARRLGFGEMLFDERAITRPGRRE